jgi:hypothetical protein
MVSTVAVPAAGSMAANHMPWPSAMAVAEFFNMRAKWAKTAMEPARNILVVAKPDLQPQ